MKSSVKVKSYLSTTPIHSIPHTGEEKQKIRLSFSNQKKDSFGPISQSEDCLKTYFNMLPDHKKKHNVSIFNFFIKKSPKKAKDIEFVKQSRGFKNSFQQVSQSSKRLFEPYPSLSTEKLKIIHNESKKKLEISTQKLIRDSSQHNNSKNSEEYFANKINQSLSKQAKFDRKKYMYYRYRKRPIQQKSDVSMNDCTEISKLENKKFKRLHSFVNSKIQEFENTKNEEDDQKEKRVEFKRSFYGIIPPKNNSFSEIKCKLTIEPVRRQISYSVMDRQTFSKTTRERQRTRMQTSGTKIFSQAIHFKGKKTKVSSNSPSKENPQKSFEIPRQQKILGWNFAEQQQHEQQYF